jgi:hypothetical protein
MNRERGRGGEGEPRRRKSREREGAEKEKEKFEPQRHRETAEVRREIFLVQNPENLISVPSAIPSAGSEPPKILVSASSASLRFHLLVPNPKILVSASSVSLWFQLLVLDPKPGLRVLCISAVPTSGSGPKPGLRVLCVSVVQTSGSEPQKFWSPPLPLSL